MAKKGGNGYDAENEVDLFELSRRREQAEMIGRSIDEADLIIRQEDVPVVNEVPARHSSENNKGMQRRNHQRNEANFDKIIKLLLIAAVVCGIMIVTSAYKALSGIKHVEVNTQWSDVRADAAPDWPLRSDQNISNILLLGIDGDGGENQRSDTIMILTLDGNADVIKMTSILRDTYVFIPGREKKTRINHAYAYGGAALTMRTVESNFRIDLDRYVGIDMDGLTVVVDQLGGVDIPLTAKEASVINQHVKNSSLTAGPQHLNGEQATYYARIRKIDSDFGRTGRQRKLIKAMLSQIKNIGPLEQYSLVSNAAPYFTTNLSNTELLALACKAAGMLESDTQEMSVPVKGAYQSKTISKMAVLVPDLPENCKEMHRFIFGSIPD